MNDGLTRRCCCSCLGRLVTYADPATAEAAIERLNNAELGGRPIHIRLDRKEVEASGGFPGDFLGVFFVPLVARV